MKPLPVIAVAMMSVCAGCTSSPTSDAGHPTYVKPGLIMLTADQAQQRGIKVAPAADAAPAPLSELSPLDTSAVVASPGIKVYTFNRSADPADPELMHEEHVVYRRETTPAWRLDAPADQKILVGPKITDGRQDIQPLLSKELTTFLADERRATEANQEAIRALFQAVDALNRQQQAVLRHGAANANNPTLPASSAEVHPDSPAGSQP